ncbi:hypothetical protein DKX38_024965 [Salix brachista]|uniref:Uncharacterized protein n=1 Tax=Salix brachista TaxID=2182728 RepID=A0A5N5JPL5_9ROSI|nr:hypothetical protein DKX38_024965 [Salix brachista]
MGWAELVWTDGVVGPKMEEEAQCLKINGEEDFYEKIEAPKFVDLNAPDHYHPGDDRSWFCLRVGCDQKHEEEMDSEAIYKKFVLRVMAARSPNIRLRKALYRNDSRCIKLYIKCPQTVPAKSSKPRVSRLALISSISKRTVDPQARVRNKKRLSNPNAFCSVRNPKATAVAVPNSIKKLEITEGKKHEFMMDCFLKISREKNPNLSNIEEKSNAKANTSGCNEPNQRPYSRIDERGLGENDVPKLLASREDDNGTNEGHGEEDERNSSMDKGIDGPMESNDKKPLKATIRKMLQPLMITEMDINTGHLKRQILGKHESLKSTQKIDKAKRKPSKESFVTHATGAQELRHRKPKPTNPKPFRLRTDERRILKEAATSEKKLHPAPLKEILPLTRFAGGNLQKKRQNALPRNDKGLEQTEPANDTQEAFEVERNTTQKEQHQNQTTRLKNKERDKTTAQNLRNVLKKTKVAPLKKYSEDKTTAQNLRKVLKKTKSPFVRKVARPQETSSITNETLSIMIPGQLGVIKEDSPTILRPKEAEKPSKSSASPEIKASAVSRQSLQGKRSATIPKEPNFHTIHTPKSCTRGVA